jgi:hypothetical protein
MAMDAVFLAEAGTNQAGWGAWVALAVTLAAVMALLKAIVEWIAGTHPTPVEEAPVMPTPAAAPPESSVPGGLSAETVAIISAALCAELQSPHRIASIQSRVVSVEAMMQIWSMEGRKQIYTSHRLR